MRRVAEREEILRACEALFAPGQVVELRGLDAVTRSYARRHTVAGYFDDMDRLARAAESMQARGVYVTLNPVERALLSRAANRLIDVGAHDPLTADGDILARRWLPVDLDPVRPAGVSASEAEHQAARARGLAVADWLTGQGWPEPVLADSGNGMHLLYRVELPAEDGGLIGRVLGALAARFDDAAVKVDQKVFNPARIWKLYGTVAAKGDDTAERPHRVSRLICVPEVVGVVAREALAEVGGAGTSAKAAAHAPVTTNLTTNGTTNRFDIEKWIAAHNLDVVGPRAWQGGRKWVFRACPWRPQHTNGSAFIAELPGGAIAAGCHHDSCLGENWRTLRRLVEGAPLEEAPLEEVAEEVDTVASDAHWPPADDGGTYFVEGGRLWRRTFAARADGSLVETKRQVVADFAVRIVAEERTEAGGVAFTMAGATATGKPMRVTLPVEEFIAEKGLLAGLTAAAGASCPVHAGMASCLRPAIQALSRDARVVRTFARTGWAEVDGAKRFLLPGREVAGVTVRLRKLPYRAPGDGHPPGGCALARGVAGLRSLLNSLEPERTTVIAALAFQAPLARLAGWTSERYAVFIAGRTGSLKTSFAQALMTIYGAGFAEDQFLLKFGEGATRNALLSYAEQACDLPLLVDNYKPNTGDGARGLVNLLHNLIEGSGRERLNRYSELQEAKPIGCWPLLTGEDAPRGDAAALARLLVAPVKWSGGGENVALAAAQAAARDMPWIGAAWLDWLEADAGRHAAGRAAALFESRRLGWAARLSGSGALTNPLRLATNLATNELTWEVLDEHPVLGAVAREFAAAHAAGLRLLAGAMARQTAETVEAARFGEVLQQLLASGACRLVERGGSREGEDVIGWRAPDGGAYLLPDLARRAVEVALGGEGLNRVSNEALYGQLEEMGYLGTKDAGRRTKALRLEGGRSVRVLHLASSALGQNEADG